MLSITTDYARDKGCPEPDLRRIANAGFTHVHWCHQWNTDFLYSKSEVDQIAAWMREFGLALNDLHASHGVEKAWGSRLEYERLAGVELVQNRIDMTARLGGDVIIIHTGDEPEDEAAQAAFWEPLWKSLDELEPFALERGVRIAIENGRFRTLRKVLKRYAPDYVGLCYDCGHGNLAENGPNEVEAIKDRIIAVHLHDNDGLNDQHKLLFTGTIDWSWLARVLAASSYRKPVSMELSIRNTGISDEDVLLAKALEVGMRFTEMIEAAKASAS